MLNSLYLILFTIVLVSLMVFLLLKGLNLNININVHQALDAEEIQKLQDIYDNQGNPKNNDSVASMDTVIKAINEVMLGDDYYEQERK